MTLKAIWQRIQNYRAWKGSTEPHLWNDETGELYRFTSLAEMPAGIWWLRRPLTLPVSSQPLFLTVAVWAGKLDSPGKSSSSRRRRE